MMRIAVTGADGFLGRRLMARFAAEGWDATGLVRNPASKGLDPARYFHYAFPDEVDERALEPWPDVVVHCAFAMRDFENYAQNRRAMEFWLKKRPSPASTRILFISSMSAHEGAESRYGREKLVIERMLDGGHDASLRPGFIVGNGGVFLNLAQSIRKLPAVPLFYGGGQPIHTVWVEDVAEAAARVISGGLTGVYHVAEAEAVTVGDFYGAVAARMGVKRPQIPLPGAPALALLRVTEAMGLQLPMHSDNLLGLKRLIRVDLSADLRALGMKPRAMEESLDLVDWNWCER